ncbi:putative spermidine/putrescine transport system permease protein|uniref:Putative spermidine/putrescine transport system permease protein n=1 Tax=Brenneria salicis ATCC 15712 = DSM 30166 TaxID=714314 RepID=A0A366IA03_9GAMM|nr:ABC transporter permease [Brenneria salicis]NMN91797.1 putative spermidine/putrescine transport system permease protein [Brenneria salicis ATCC 15712 = DSM 30166]RBP65864.1 putative spermidine/putrescine transport system permease protein [Brenneria salicis ATCC 15712 = DSM 30166]RLM31894.1 polyamine ABC transporter substrate-binding protein [Brenneria salicis ATCC 15712 = DSM 30166]
MSQSEMLAATPPSSEKEGNSQLKQQLRAAQVVYKRRSMLLIAPLFLFIVVSFLFPIISILGKSVSNPELRDTMPATIAAMRDWSGDDIPDESVFKAVISDLRAARSGGKLPTITKRLGYEGSEYRTLITRTLRKLPPDGSSDIRGHLISEQPLWGELSTWRTLERASRPFTSYYLLAVFDHKVDAKTQNIVAQPPQQALYVDVLLRTLLMAGIVTLLCVGLGYPLAYWLAKQPANRANLLLILVLLPFWTSLIVRTASWIVLLQSGGLINRSLMSIGIIDEPLVLVFNRVGVYISMTHILLPFFILPLYAVMKGISPNSVRAAVSLGAHPFIAFWRVYVPQTYAGVTAGALLVFMMAIGYYITPALLGGPSDQMLSYFVAFFTNTTMNWGMAAALGTQLLVIVTLLYIVYIRITRTNMENAAR